MKGCPSTSPGGERKQPRSDATSFRSGTKARIRSPVAAVRKQLGVVPGAMGTMLRTPGSRGRAWGTIEVPTLDGGTKQIRVRMGDLTTEEQLERAVDVDDDDDDGAVGVPDDVGDGTGGYVSPASAPAAAAAAAAPAAAPTPAPASAPAPAPVPSAAADVDFVLSVVVRCRRWEQRGTRWNLVALDRDAATVALSFD